MVNNINKLGKMVRFAEDTTLYTKGSSPVSALEDSDMGFERVKEWFVCNKFIPNEDKTEKIICSL